MNGKGQMMSDNRQEPELSPMVDLSAINAAFSHASEEELVQHQMEMFDGRNQSFKSLCADHFNSIASSGSHLQQHLQAPQVPPESRPSELVTNWSIVGVPNFDVSAGGVVLHHQHLPAEQSHLAHHHHHQDQNHLAHHHHHQAPTNSEPLTVGSALKIAKGLIHKVSRKNKKLKWFRGDHPVVKKLQKINDERKKIISMCREQNSDAELPDELGQGLKKLQDDIEKITSEVNEESKKVDEVASLFLNENVSDKTKSEKLRLLCPSLFNKDQASPDQDDDDDNDDNDEPVEIKMSGTYKIPPSSSLRATLARSSTGVLGSVTPVSIVAPVAVDSVQADKKRKTVVGSDCADVMCGLLKSVYPGGFKGECSHHDIINKGIEGVRALVLANQMIPGLEVENKKLRDEVVRLSGEVSTLQAGHLIETAKLQEQIKRLKKDKEQEKDFKNSRLKVAAQTLARTRYEMIREFKKGSTAEWNLMEARREYLAAETGEELPPENEDMVLEGSAGVGDSRPKDPKDDA